MDQQRENLWIAVYAAIIAQQEHTTYTIDEKIANSSKAGTVADKALQAFDVRFRKEK